MPRMTRAQRAAVGPTGGRPLADGHQFTPAQNERVHGLKAAFGAKNVGTPRRLPITGYMLVPMMNGVGRSWWVFDDTGKYIERYTQLSLHMEGTHGDTTGPSTLPKTHSQY